MWVIVKYLFLFLCCVMNVVCMATIHGFLSPWCDVSSGHRWIRGLMNMLMKLRIYKSLGVSSPLCVLELSRLTRVEKAVKNTTMIVIYKVLVYIQISANYMFRPLLVRPSSGWIPSPRKYTIVLYNHWSQGGTRFCLQKWGIPLTRYPTWRWPN